MPPPASETTVNALDAEISALQAQRAQRETSLARAEQQKSSLKSGVDAAEAKLAAARDAHEAQQRELSRLRGALTQMQDEMVAGAQAMPLQDEDLLDALQVRVHSTCRVCQE